MESERNIIALDTTRVTALDVAEAVAARVPLIVIPVVAVPGRQDDNTGPARAKLLVVAAFVAVGRLARSAAAIAAMMPGDLGNEHRFWVVLIDCQLSALIDAVDAFQLAQQGSGPDQGGAVVALADGVDCDHFYSLVCGLSCRHERRYSQWEWYASLWPPRTGDWYARPRIERACDRASPGRPDSPTWGMRQRWPTGSQLQGSSARKPVGQDSSAR